MEKIDLTLVVPCYNEGKELEESVKEVINVLDGTYYRWEIIFVDDFSQDNTREIIEKILIKYPGKNFRKIYHAKNIGRGKTVTDGIMQAKGEIVGFIDIDLEVGPWYIPPLVRKIKNGADVCFGERIYKFHWNALDRYITSRFYNFLVRKLLKIPFQDTEAGYKFFRKERFLPVLKKVKNEGWFWDTEVMALSYYEGLNIDKIPVLFIRRSKKHSTVKLFHDSVVYLKNLLKFLRSQKIKSENNYLYS